MEWHNAYNSLDTDRLHVELDSLQHALTNKLYQQKSTESYSPTSYIDHTQIENNTIVPFCSCFSFPTLITFSRPWIKFDQKCYTGPKVKVANQPWDVARAVPVSEEILKACGAVLTHEYGQPAYFEMRVNLRNQFFMLLLNHHMDCFANKDSLLQGFTI